MEKLIIRQGQKADIQALFILIKELAQYEKAMHEVENTPEILLNDAFGSTPSFGFLVAEIEGTIVGTSVYYIRYSTWKGRRLFIEDIIVTENYRKKGIGTMLMNASLQKSIELNCNGAVWQVLDWNTPAIEFYKKFGVAFDSEWINVALAKSQIEAHLKSLSTQ